MDPILKTITEVQTINAKLREENERLRAMWEKADSQRVAAERRIEEIHKTDAETQNTLFREIDRLKAEVARLEGLILDWERGDRVSRIGAEDALWAEACRIRGERDGKA